MTVLIACGLQREARIFAGPGVVAIAGGGDALRLEAELERHAGEARLILSCGLCGALDPAFKVGDLVIGGLAPPPFTSPQWGEVDVASATEGEGDRGFPERADPPHPALRADLSPPGRGEDPRFASDVGESLVRRLGSLLPDARFGALAGVDRIVATAAEKAALRAKTGAIAADMESHVAERVARRRGLPFAILRAVSDHATRSLPPAALVGMRPDGGVDLGAVLKSLAKNPAQLPALIKTGRDAEKAFRALLGGFHRLRAGAGDLDAHLLDVV